MSFHLLDALARKANPALTPTLDTEHLHRVLDYIDDNMHERIKTQAPAKIAGFSESHFSKLFKSTTGMTTYGYVTRRRLQLAEALLRMGKMRIVDVAVEVGFYDQSHLDRSFQRFCQCSPIEFARKAR